MNKKQIRQLKKIAESLPPTLKMGELIVTGEVLKRDYSDRINPEQKIDPSARYRIKVPVKVDHVKELQRFYKNNSLKEREASIASYIHYVNSIYEKAITSAATPDSELHANIANEPSVSGGTDGVPVSNGQPSI